MLHKILVEAGPEFSYALLNILVEGRNNRANFFSVRRLVMRIKVRPHRGARLDVAKLEFHGDAGHERASGDLLEIIETPVQKKVSADIASQSINSLIMAGGAELP